MIGAREHAHKFEQRVHPDGTKYGIFDCRCGEALTTEEIQAAANVAKVSVAPSAPAPSGSGLAALVGREVSVQFLHAEEPDDARLLAVDDRGVTLELSSSRGMATFVFWDRIASISWALPKS